MQILRSKGLKALEKTIERARAAGDRAIYEGLHVDFPQVYRDVAEGKDNDAVFYLCEYITEEARCVRNCVDRTIDAVTYAVRRLSLEKILYDGDVSSSLLGVWVDYLNDAFDGDIECNPAEALTVYDTVERVSRYFRIDPPSIILQANVDGYFELSFKPPVPGL